MTPSGLTPPSLTLLWSPQAPHRCPKISPRRGEVAYLQATTVGFHRSRSPLFFEPCILIPATSIHAPLGSVRRLPPIQASEDDGQLLTVNLSRPDVGPVKYGMMHNCRACPGPGGAAPTTCRSGPAHLLREPPPAVTALRSLLAAAFHAAVPQIERPPPLPPSSLIHEHIQGFRDIWEDMLATT